MDLNQTKLSKSEWEGIEVPISEREKSVLALIKSGFADINIRQNNNHSIMSFIKITPTPEIETFLYKTYFQTGFEKMTRDYAKRDVAMTEHLLAALAVSPGDGKRQPNSKDAIRLENMKDNIDTHSAKIVEFFIADQCRAALKSRRDANMDYTIHIYTLTYLTGLAIPSVNRHVLHFAHELVKWFEQKSPTLIGDMLHNAQAIFEKNANILKYADITLYEHQKRLFQLFGAKSDKTVPKLVLYIAPTGTGKTLSPIGLTESCRVIFVCTARHVGLALARAAVSAEKRIAFAFGCETASDIRLHYFAAADYSRNRKSGGIFRVDNSNGTKVELMICDIKSYLTAMHYMLAFNAESDIVTFWDEPTITMDYEEHELHATIHENWTKNQISKMVLSCATLPFESEIQDTIDDFRGRFDMTEVHSISTYDCKKTISMLNKEGKIVLPHLLFSQYRELQTSVTHCEQMKSLMRYFDLAEIIRFIEHVCANGYVSEQYHISAYFKTISDINMDNIKAYYLNVLKHLDEERWSELSAHLSKVRKPMFEKYINPYEFRKTQSEGGMSNMNAGGGAPLTRMASLQPDQTQTHLPVNSTSKPDSNSFAGMLLTTEDAHTLTDGPTIYLAENVENVGKFLIMSSKIPPKVLDSVMTKIEHNNAIQKKIDKTMLDIEAKDKKDQSADKTAKSKPTPGSKDKERDTVDKTMGQSREVRELTETVNALRAQIVLTNMDSAYIPNTKHHQQLWVKGGKKVDNAFVANIDDESIREIMALPVSSQFKLLLLLGIGMFVKDENKQYTEYMEVMKRLATSERLFIIIASSDYIYGTNYQFSHGFIGKDIVKMTQQKTIQAMGRVGRGNVQNTYTVRFRDDGIIRQLFLPAERNLEAEKMSSLLNSMYA